MANRGIEKFISKKPQPNKWPILLYRGHHPAISTALSVGHHRIHIFMFLRLLEAKQATSTDSSVLCLDSLGNLIP